MVFFPIVIILQFNARHPKSWVVGMVVIFAASPNSNPDATRYALHLQCNHGDKDGSRQSTTGAEAATAD